MSSPALNPLESLHAPPAPPKLTDKEAADVIRRDIATFVLLNIVTLGIYWFYVVYRWSKEVNGLVGTVKYQPMMVLLVSILTCGIGGFVFECLMAFDVAETCKSRGVPSRLAHMPQWVIGCNVASLIACIIPFGVIVGLPLGLLASVLLQVELNKLADGYAAQ
jgi:hypothetical protein